MAHANSKPLNMFFFPPLSCKTPLFHYPLPISPSLMSTTFACKSEAYFAALCHPAELKTCSAPPFCDGDMEKERKECLLVFSRIHPKCSIALERMWDGFVASADDLSHVTQGVTNERALLFIRAVFSKALKPVPSHPSASTAPSSSAPTKPPPPKPATSIISNAPAPSSAPAISHAEGKRPSVVRGGGYGLDVAVAEKIAAKYDAESEGKMRDWITGELFGWGLIAALRKCDNLSAVTTLSPGSDQTFAEWLKNG
jgi:hypothetical protein